VVFGPKKKADLGGAVVQLGRISGTGTRYVARVLAPGVEHRFAIQAIGKPGETSKRAKFNVVVPTAAERTGVVPAPRSVQAKLTAPGEITVWWDAVPGATAYSIGRSIQPGGFRRLCELCDPTKPKYVDRDVTPGEIHSYSVATVTPQGRSKVTRSNGVTPTGHSTPDSADAEDSGPPEKPEEVKAVATSPNSIALSWEAGEGATGYEISRRINNGEPRVLVPTTVNTRYVDNQATVSAKGALSYGVTSLNSNGRSEEVTVFVHWGDTATAQQSKDAIDLKAGVKSGNTVLLTFPGLLAGHQYQIQRQIAGGLSSVIATITGSMSSYLDNLGRVQGTIRYMIADLNGKGASNRVFITLNSASIDSAKARTDSASSLSKGPSNLTATVLSPATVRLNWILPNAGMAGQAMRFIRIYRQVENRALVLIGTVDPQLATFIDHLQGNFMGLTYAIEAVYEKGPSQRATVSIDPRKGLVPEGEGASGTSGGKGPAANPVSTGPSDVTAVLNPPNTVVLTWNPLAGETYEIRRSIGTGLGQVVATIASTAGRYVDELPPSAGSQNTAVVYRIRNANDNVAAPVLVTIDPGSGTSETIEDPALDSLRTRGRGKAP
jgi:hypothetical protein